jgi:hypothetical protein
MALQTLLQAKIFITNLALEWFLSSMGYRMFLKVIVTRKPFKTNLATIGFLARVNAVMLSEIPVC